MVLLFDQIAQRYGVLPSEFVARGTIWDIGIMMKSIAWQRERDRRSRYGQSMPVHTHHSQKELVEMLRKAQS